MRAVNLLTPDQRSAPKGKGSSGPSGVDAPGGIGAFVLLGALALSVAALAGYVLSNNVIKERKAELATVTAKSDATVQKAAKLKPYADFDASAKARAQTVRDIAGSRFDWEQALRDLSRAIPQDVTLTQLSGDIATDAGGQGGTLRTAISAPAITLTGCTSGQTQVARLMARLRDIDGVTRVSLSSSAKELVEDADANDANADRSEVERRLAAPCGTGERPAFELVMFFEGAAAKVATTPVTATGTVSETPTPTPTATPEGGAPADGTTTTTTTTTDGDSK